MDKMQNDRKLTQTESLFAGKLIAMLPTRESVETDDMMESDPTSFAAGSSADAEEASETEIIQDFEKWYMRDFYKTHYPFFNETNVDDDPLPKSDVRGDLQDFLDNTLASASGDDNVVMGSDGVDMCLEIVVKDIAQRGWKVEDLVDEATSQTSAQSMYQPGMMVATDMGPAAIVSVGKTKLKVQLNHGKNIMVDMADVDLVDGSPQPRIPELYEMENWFEQFDPSTILEAPINEHQPFGHGFSAIVCNAFKDGETVDTISKWSLVAPELIQDILDYCGVTDQDQMAAVSIKTNSVMEARSNMYWSVFSLYNGKWCHIFDADDQIDARAEAQSDKDQGNKTMIIRVPRDQTNWGQGPGKVDAHSFVMNHLAKKAGKATPAMEDQIKEAAVPSSFSGFMNDGPAFVEQVEQSHGWSVAKQASDVIDGEAYHEQNDAALKMIAGLAANRGEDDLCDSIKEYLSGPLNMDETLGGDMGDDFENDVKKHGVMDDEEDDGVDSELAHLRKMAGIE
jgi:hypothetical protein